MKIQPNKIKKLYDLIDQHGVEAVDNFYLRLNKGIKREYDKRDKNKIKIKSGSGVLMDLIKDKKYKYSHAFIKKQNYIIKSFVSQGYEVARYTFSPFKKIIVGLGQESVREISMTLHWIYGTPYIPGQAIKGVVSNWLIEEGAKTDKNYDVIFGNQDSKGQVIFMDSYPENMDFSINLDIMNPHYFHYYTGNMGPTDWQNPNPIFFLTLKNVKFNINLVYLDVTLKDKKIRGKTLEGWLKEALKYGGVGAKTALGYGKGELIPMKGD